MLTGPDGSGIDDLKEKLSRVLKDKVRRGSLDEEERLRLTQLSRHGTLEGRKDGGDGFELWFVVCGLWFVD